MPKDSSNLYNPSWIDYFSIWVAGLPGPRWMYYIGIGMIIVIIQAAPTWLEGAVMVGTFLPTHIFLAAATAFILAMIPYFDDRAQSALETIKPSLTIDEAEIQKLAYQLTKLPALKSILASILALVFLFITEFVGGGAYYMEDLAGYPFSTNLSRVIYLLCWWFFGVFIYHTVHQLGLINQIYTRHTLIDLFRMKPLYGFSNLAALTAVSLIMLPYGFLYVNPEVQLTNPVILSTYVVISVIALATFLLPQLGIHRLQQEEKDRLLGDINQRYKATMGEVHKRVDSEKFDSAATLVDALGALTNERKTISGISTWPWQPETFRWLFTAMVLPLILWLAQHFLGQLLNS